MLRKVMWAGMAAAFGAAAALAARWVSAGIWRLATGEQPPETR
jgi:hypothetical protein